MPSSFIVVDDDPISNLITRQVILEALDRKPAIITFTDPFKALEHLSTAIPDSGTVQFILLDINMPPMSGWEFLERFGEMGEAIVHSNNIYILSSSVDVRDHEKASVHKLLKGYLVKPLNISSVQDLVKSYQ